MAFLVGNVGCFTVEDGFIRWSVKKVMILSVRIQGLTVKNGQFYFIKKEKNIWNKLCSG